MYKSLALIAAAVFSLSAQAAYKDGTYTGEGVGNASRITVEVKVSNGKIKAVKVLKHGETEMLLRAAENKIARKVIKKNSTDGIDVVTGASNSSKGILSAVNQALDKAK